MLSASVFCVCGKYTKHFVYDTNVYMYHVCLSCPSVRRSPKTFVYLYVKQDRAYRIKSKSHPPITPTTPVIPFIRGGAAQLLLALLALLLLLVVPETSLLLVLAFE